MYPNAPEGITTTSLIQTPEPLNGQELWALLIFSIATELAKVAVGSPHNSSILAFRNYDFEWGMVCNGKSAGSDIGVPPVKIEVSGKLQFSPDKRLVDIMRILSGVGVWHRGALGENRTIDYQSRPSQKMLEHLGKLLASDDLLKSFIPLYGGLNSVERVSEYKDATTAPTSTTTTLTTPMPVVK